MESVKYGQLSEQEKADIHIKMYNEAESVSDPHLRFFEHPIHYANNIREGFVIPDNDFNFFRTPAGVEVRVKEPLK